MKLMPLFWRAALSYMVGHDHVAPAALDRQDDAVEGGLEEGLRDADLGADALREVVVETGHLFAGGADVVLPRRPRDVARDPEVVRAHDRARQHGLQRRVGRDRGEVGRRPGGRRRGRARSGACVGLKLLDELELLLPHAASSATMAIASRAATDLGRGVALTSPAPEKWNTHCPPPFPWRRPRLLRITT